VYKASFKLSFQNFFSAQEPKNRKKRVALNEGEDKRSERKGKEAGQRERTVPRSGKDPIKGDGVNLQWRYPLPWIGGEMRGKKRGGSITSDEVKNKRWLSIEGRKRDI